MAHKASVQRLLREYDKLQKLNSNQFICEPDPQNIFIWHFVIFNLTDQFQGGQYHGILQLPPEYPLKPPKLQFFTPSGRFETGKPICLSFTNFHPESWSATQTIESMMISLISFMYSNDQTTGGINSSDSEKRSKASQSIQFNLQNEQFNKIFQKHFDKLGISNNFQKSNKQINNINDNVKIVDEEENKITFTQFMIGGITILLVIYIITKSTF